MKVWVIRNNLSFTKVFIRRYKLIRKKWNRRRFRNEAHKFGVNDEAYMIIRRSSSNIILTLTDLVGKVVYVCCSGYVGMDGRRRKGSFWAADKLGTKLGRYALSLNLRFVFIILEAPTSIVVSSAIHGLVYSGIKLLGVHYRYCLPHNGCRTRKPRRL